MVTGSKLLYELSSIAMGIWVLQGTGLSYSGKLMAVGRARMDGVEVHGNSSLLGMSGFEAYAKSTAHRPAQFSFTSNGLSLQVCLACLPPALFGSSSLRV